MKLLEIESSQPGKVDFVDLFTAVNELEGEGVECRGDDGGEQNTAKMHAKQDKARREYFLGFADEI